MHVFIFNIQSGKLQVFDIANGTLLESVEAHTGAVWSICLAPNKVKTLIIPLVLHVLYRILTLLIAAVHCIWQC
jgi:hypothetical protein